MVSPSCQLPLSPSNPSLLFIVPLLGFQISCWSTSWHVVYTEIPSSAYSKRQLVISSYQRTPRMSPLYSMEAILPRSAAQLVIVVVEIELQSSKYLSWSLISYTPMAFGHEVLIKVIIPTNLRSCVISKIAPNSRIKAIDFGHRWMGKQVFISVDFLAVTLDLLDGKPLAVACQENSCM